MSSSADRFWSAVGRWCSSNPKPWISVEASANWPLVSFRAKVDDFVPSKSILFGLEDGENLREINLEGCEIRPGSIGRDLEESEFVCVFRAACEGDGAVVFTFIELRDLGKPI
jgi:hypothetical protein